MEKFKEILKEKLVDETFNPESLDLMKELGFTENDKEASEELINQIIKSNVRPCVEKIIYNLKDELQDGDPDFENMELGVDLKVLSDVLLPLVKGLPVGVLLSMGINAVVEKVKMNILQSIEMSVLGTLQNFMRETGNTAAADMIKREMESKISDLDTSRIEVQNSRGEDITSSSHIVNEMKEKKNILNRKDDDDDDFNKHLMN